MRGLLGFRALRPQFVAIATANLSGKTGHAPSLAPQSRRASGGVRAFERGSRPRAGGVVGIAARWSRDRLLLARRPGTGRLGRGDKHAAEPRRGTGRWRQAAREAAAVEESAPPAVALTAGASTRRLLRSGLRDSGRRRRRLYSAAVGLRTEMVERAKNRRSVNRWRPAKTNSAAPAIVPRCQAEPWHRTKQR
jgi:hypothetical protein